MASGIYRIDLGNENFYIGSATNFAKRKSKHRRDLECGVHLNKFVQNCWNKYGVFKFAILEECSVDELIVKEQSFLDRYFDDPKMTNILPTAGSSLGHVHSIETRAKMSATRKGKTLSVKTRARMSEAKRNISAETRAKMSAAWKSRLPASAETCAKISKAKKAYYARKREAT